MSDDFYVVTGATGHIGSVLAERLLSSGHKVRVIGRDRKRLEPLAQKGAEPVVGSLDDAGFLTNAFRGSRAVFAMIPPNYTAEDYRKYENSIADSLIAAIRNSGVSHVVALSSLGAEHAEGTGPIKGLRDFEQKLNRLDGVNVLILRPTFFMENLLMGIPAIKAMGVNGSGVVGDVPVPMIATRDIAKYAARAIKELSFSDKRVQELLGPADVSMEQATAVLGKAIGKSDLNYQQFPADNVRQAMIGAGLSPSLVDELVELDSAMNSGLIRSQGRTAESTTPTTIEEFAPVFAAAFKA
jgi:uncharacterized protein YbjT (DUF2867 family)